MKFLSTIDIDKVTGSDMIGPGLLKVAAPYIADEFAILVLFILCSQVNGK